MSPIDKLEKLDIKSDVELGIFDLILYPCPFCGSIPKPQMPIDLEDEKKTWIWSIKCSNLSCKINPETSHVSIRKTCKKDFIRIWLKVKDLQDYWNERVEKIAPVRIRIEHPTLIRYLKND